MEELEAGEWYRLVVHPKGQRSAKILATKLAKLLGDGGRAEAVDGAVFGMRLPAAEG